MLRRIGWTVPLSLGALVCLIGCTFPKSFGLARKQEPDPQAQVAKADAADAADASRDAEAKPRTTSLVQTLRKPVDWLAAKRQAQKAAKEQALADQGPSAPDGSPTLSYPNVVPPKYRTMDSGVSAPSVARDSSGTPSLVRPSRRPPPDPAPKPPIEVQPESQVAQQPRVEDPLYDMIAVAARSWRVEPPRHVAGAPSGAPASNVAPAESAAPAESVAPDSAHSRQLATETHLKFAPPDLTAREQKQVRKSLDIATNILRPARPDAPTADPSAATTAAAAGTPGAQRTEPQRPAAPSTTWVAKKSPLPVTPTSDSTPAVTPGAPQVPDTGVPAVSQTNSTVVANTFGTQASQPAAGPSPGPTRPAALAAGPPPASAPTSKTDRPQVTIPDRSEAVARAEAARADGLAHDRPVYVAKTPSHARPSVPTQAAPPAAMEQELLAPLVDANTYRAQLASTPGDRATPVHTAARESSPAAPGSWVAAYEQLLQRTDASPAPQAPAGSPSRSLRSDDAPELPRLATPTLRR